MIKNMTIIFRTTNCCNLNCKYCYDKENHKRKNIENENFNSKIPLIVSNLKKIWKNKEQNSEIIFHGGEPLIISSGNYEKLIKEIKNEYPNTIISMQTNGTLINEEFIRLFKKYNIHLGISLDGFNNDTNKNRIFSNGKNSFNLVMKNINHLKKNSIKFGVIMTLTSEILGKEEELYDFIAKEDIKCNIRPAFKSNDSDVKYMTDNQYFEFYKKIFNIWVNDDKRRVKLTQIKELYDEFAKVLEPNYSCRSCSSSGKCFENFISLDCNGNLYSCNRTYNNKEFYYGNISKLTCIELEEKIYSKVYTRKNLIENSKCKQCLLYNECHGGCPANGYALNNDMGIDTNFCVAKNKIRNYVKDYMKKNNIEKQYIEMKKNAK